MPFNSGFGKEEIKWAAALAHTPSYSLIWGGQAKLRTAYINGLGL